MSSYTEGQVHQLANALEGAGFTPDDVTKLGQNKGLGDIRGVLIGTHEIKPIAHLIDCDAAPFIPSGWTVKEHRNGGQLTLDLAKVSLYLSKEQQNGKCKWIMGNELRKELANKPVLNANVLDYLLANPHLIPEEWKEKFVFFWGTIYRDRYGHLHIRSLRRSGGRWGWGAYWLGGDWHDGDPAAMLAS